MRLSKLKQTPPNIACYKIMSDISSVINQVLLQFPYVFPDVHNYSDQPRSNWSIYFKVRAEKNSTYIYGVHLLWDSTQGYRTYSDGLDVDVVRHSNLEDATFAVIRTLGVPRKKKKGIAS